MRLPSLSHSATDEFTPTADTVVTFFPSNKPTIDQHDSAGDLYRHIFDKLTTHPRYPTRVFTVFDLMALIVLMSSSITFDTSHHHHNIDVFTSYERLITKNVSLPTHAGFLSETEKAVLSSQFANISGNLQELARSRHARAHAEQGWSQNKQGRPDWE